MNMGKHHSALGWIFICVFIYALMAMALSRELVIPHFMPSAIDGNIQGDPYYYHLLAIKKTVEMKALGIEEFELRPEGQGPAGLASLAYLAINNPYSVVLINALLHGVSVVIMTLILVRWFPLRTSLIAITPLAVSPHMMLWFSQLNKDSFALVGSLLFIYGLMRFICADGKTIFRSGLISLFVMVVGIVLLWVVRPYVNQILLPIVAIVLMIGLLLRTIGNHRYLGGGWFYAIYGAFVLANLGLLGHGAASDQTIAGFNHYEQVTKAESKAESKAVFLSCLEKIDKNTWRDEWFLPDYAESKLRAMMGQRCLIFTILDTQDNPTTLRSVVDADIMPGGSVEALRYFPRAVLLGVFSPWPRDWVFVFEYGPSFFYTLVPLEAILLYAGLGGLCLWLLRTRQWAILTPVGISAAVMSIYAMATPFLGALYRYRYPWWMVMICIGVAATFEVVRCKAHEG